MTRRRFLAAAALALCGWRPAAARAADGGLVGLDSAAVAAALARGVPVVDIRTAPEWAETGVIPGVRRLTAFDAGGALAPDFFARLATIAGPGDDLVLICRSGNRTRRLGRLLVESHGYRRLFHAERGMLGWLAEGRPVERP